MFQIFLCLDGGLGTASCGHDCLAVMRIGYVASGKDSRNIGQGAVTFGQDVSRLIRLDPRTECVAVGTVTDGKKESVDRKVVCALVGLTLAEDQMGTLHTILSIESQGIRLEENLDLGIPKDTLLHDLACTKAS